MTAPLDVLRTHHPLVLCEGAAENVIIRKLLEADKLIFPKDNLHDIAHTRSARAVQEKHLNFHFDYPVCIVRIADSPSEKFELSNLHRDRFPVLSFYTRPEIEMLVIIAEGKAAAYGQRGGERLRPSEYCKQQLGLSKVKSEQFLEGYWTAERIVDAAHEYKRTKHLSKGELCLADLIA